MNGNPRVFSQTQLNLSTSSNEARVLSFLMCDVLLLETKVLSSCHGLAITPAEFPYLYHRGSFFTKRPISCSRNRGELPSMTKCEKNYDSEKASKGHSSLQMKKSLPLVQLEAPDNRVVEGIPCWDEKY
ncbi:hypothetical protein VNO77_22683 [Canavalia gladiata]|uniref:Uncharacterized protein n=1 Tax=Canavalia gladiata TaxID=3824 RepID=A0AAN9L4H1_CANGL